MKGYIKRFVNQDALLRKIKIKKNAYKARVSKFKENIKNIKQTGYATHKVGYYFVFEEAKVCFVDNTKVASTSIKEVLLAADGVLLKNTPYRNVHIYCTAYRKRKLEKTLPYFSFSIVRNPFERVVSTYKNMYKGSWSTFDFYLFGRFKKDKGFEHFVKKGAVQVTDKWADEHLISQYILICDKNEKPYADFVGRFENLSKDWQSIQEKVVGLGDLPHRNQTSKDDWRNYYNKELARIVYNRYQKDFKIFGYEEEYVKLLAYLEEQENKDVRI